MRTAGTSRPRSGSFIVTLQFAPQQIVTPAILVSGATLAACVLVGFVPFGPVRRRLRRRRAHSAEKRVLEPAVGAVTAAPVGVIAAGRHTWLPRPVGNRETSTVDVSPILGSPFTSSGRPPRLLTSILVAAVCGAIAMLVLPPAWAPSIAGVTAARGARGALLLNGTSASEHRGGRMHRRRRRGHRLRPSSSSPPPGQRVAAQLRDRRSTRVSRPRRARDRHGGRTGLAAPRFRQARDRPGDLADPRRPALRVGHKSRQGARALSPPM